MQAEIQTVTEVWPPDDTEEIGPEGAPGTDFHQMTIMNVRFSINEIAHQQQQPGRPPP